ncbi:MAG: MFS transporter [Spirochaetaceae bacterium]|jgi:predicted MFS family arabinose efflux permease|nr:MFS transporter [Spirochaetaceae bacterium]
MNQTQVRQYMFLGSIIIVMAVLGFLWVLNINQSPELKQTFLVYIVVLLTFCTAGFALFYYKGAIFGVSGGLARTNIIMMTVTVLLIAQITFAFAIYSYHEMKFSFRSYDNAQDFFKSTDWTSMDIVLKKTADDLPGEIDRLYITDSKYHPEYVLPPLSKGESIQYQPIDRYIFPLPNGKFLGLHISREYHVHEVRRMLLDLFTVMVVSLFFGFELVLFLIRLLEFKMVLPNNSFIYGEERRTARHPSSHGISFIRQLAFLFYFASRMPAAFIPVIAARLAGSAFTNGGNAAASIPTSVETLLTCAAIFLSSELIIKKGWKQPFIMGILFVIAGTFLSAWAENFFVFVLARALTGLGYGFCWMTLRNLSLFGITSNERSWAFAMLNAGLYAGMNCGQTAGSILAVTLNYRAVLLIAGFTTALSGLTVLLLKNDRLAAAPSTDNDEAAHSAQNAPSDGTRSGLRSLVQMLAVLLLLIVPSCIAGSFSDFYIPLYAAGTGRDTSDVGRLLLLYGLVIVYLGPSMQELMSKRLGCGWAVNVFYNVLLAASLLLSGVFGGFGILAFSIVIMGLADGFGFGTQNDFFLALPFMRRIPASRALSILSFLKKLAAALGPVVFALGLNLPGTKGICVIGILILVAALLAVPAGREKPLTAAGRGAKMG